jgi:hypothetical protein
MTNLASEFRDVCNLYARLGEELASITATDDALGSQALIQSILDNRDCLDRIAQMQSRIMQLSEDWKKVRPYLDSELRDETQDLAAAARAQVLRLQELCATQIQKLEQTRDSLGRNLSELGKGTQFLKSIKPANSNYPKFIDSLY